MRGKLHSLSLFFSGLFDFTVRIHLAVALRRRGRRATAATTDVLHVDVHRQVVDIERLLVRQNGNLQKVLKTITF